jgi:hypothetical protein
MVSSWKKCSTFRRPFVSTLCQKEGSLLCGDLYIVSCCVSCRRFCTFLEYVPHSLVICSNLSSGPVLFIWRLRDSHRPKRRIYVFIQAVGNIGRFMKSVLCTVLLSFQTILFSPNPSSPQNWYRTCLSCCTAYDLLVVLMWLLGRVVCL